MSDQKKNSFFRSPRFIALILFGIALIPRLPGLGQFIITDEHTNIYHAGSHVFVAFLEGHWRETYWHFYPGVSMSWLNLFGLGGDYLFRWLTGQTVPSFTEYIYWDIRDILVAARLPYAVLTALSVPLLYLWGRKLLPDTVMILGSLFLALDPFYLAHSRVNHGDAPVAVFMALSVMTFFIYTERLRHFLLTSEPNQKPDFKIYYYLVGSAVLGSLAALTKAPGPFVAPFMMAISLAYGLRLRNQIKLRKNFGYWGMTILVWGIVSLLTFILLWPSMWIDPLGTFRQMWEETFGKVDAGHLVYFFGEATLDPGPWFYFYVIPFRMTPIVGLGCLFSLFLWRKSASEGRSFVLLWAFTLTLLLFGNLSPKKQDRYLLPLFPFLNLLAAVGWWGLLKLAKDSIKPIAVGLVILLHAYPVISYYPYYLTYFNPLMGGPQRAVETTLMGWGEGMEQVATYLNRKPEAESLYVAAVPAQTLLPYFVGQGENFYTNDVAFRADYVVLYVAQMQRLAPSPEIVRYFQAQEPEAEFTIQGITYAKVYPGPKLILNEMPDSALPVNVGLDDLIRLAGYQYDKSRLVLYWHALAPLTKNYTVSVRARTAEGELLAQQDSWPIQGLLPTSQWRQGDYVIDSHSLKISEQEAQQIDHFEIVIYESETGQTLGPPITLERSK